MPVRFVLANTEVLHEKIQVLSTRVRQLEDALADAHAARGSAEQHPLLSHELLQLKRPLEKEPPEAAKDPEVETAEAIDAVGSLYVVYVPLWRKNLLTHGSRSISESGRTKFYGTTANAWVSCVVREFPCHDVSLICRSRSICCRYASFALGTRV